MRVGAQQLEACAVSWLAEGLLLCWLSWNTDGYPFNSIEQFSLLLHKASCKHIFNAYCKKGRVMKSGALNIAAALSFTIVGHVTAIITRQNQKTSNISPTIFKVDRDGVNLLRLKNPRVPANVREVDVKTATSQQVLDTDLPPRFNQVGTWLYCAIIWANKQRYLSRQHWTAVDVQSKPRRFRDPRLASAIRSNGW